MFVLSENEKSKRQKLNREKSKRFRERRKESNLPNHNSEPEKLIVKLDFQRSKKNSTRKRVSRAVAKAHKKIKSLQDDNVRLQRKAWKLEKKLQRETELRRKRQKSSTQESPKTPRSKTNAVMRKEGLSQRSVPRRIRTQLVFAQAVSDEIQQSLEKGDCKQNRRRGLTASVVAGAGILKKYRCLRFVNKMTGISRNMLGKVNKKLSYPKKTRLPEESKKLTEAIVDFLKRGDNSRVMPGKDDYVKHNGEKVQKHYLNDYIHNLHSKFVAENPHIKVGKTAFAKRRPNYIIPTSFSSRRTCLCQHHQNMSLKLQAIKLQAAGVKISTSPDVFIKNHQDENAVKVEVLNKLPAQIQFSHWKRVDVDGKKKIKLLSVEMGKQNFQELFLKEVEKFRGHASRVKIQYGQLKLLKESLSEGEVFVQMDFAENYTCQTMEEVQSAYWNASMVTLHPVVAYYKLEDGTLCHKSIVFVSDELGHNSSTVYAFLKELIPQLTAILPTIKHVHYFTDSPTSQYRNKTIFYIVSRHRDLFGITASWNYFEAGHGKGPCDGVGGSVKRMADEAVRQQKVTIQDASDFFAWAQQYQSTSLIAFTFVSKDDCSKVSSEIQQFGQIHTVKGTMAVHAVASTSPGAVSVRATSCYCQQCFNKGEFNPESQCSWKKHLLKDMVEDERIQPLQGDLVAALYDGKWYVGKVLEVDLADKDANISFMHDTTKSAGCLKWPVQPDTLWIDFSSILAIIEAPVPCGKSKRQFKLNEETTSMIEHLFARQQAN